MIVTYEEAAAYVGAEGASDEQLRDATDAADRFVKDYCGRELEGGTYTEFLEGFGTRRAFLSEGDRRTRVTVTELRVDRSGVLGADTVVSIAGVWVDGNVLYYPSFFPEGLRVARVTYDLDGYYPITDTDPNHVKWPSDLRRVTLRQIARLFRQGAASEEMKSESVGDYSYTRFDDAVSPIDRLVLDRYKRWAS